MATHPLNLWRLPHRRETDPAHRGSVNSPPGDVHKITARVFTKLAPGCPVSAVMGPCCADERSGEQPEAGSGGCWRAKTSAGARRSSWVQILLPRLSSAGWAGVLRDGRGELTEQLRPDPYPALAPVADRGLRPRQSVGPCVGVRASAPGENGASTSSDRNRASECTRADHMAFLSGSPPLHGKTGSNEECERGAEEDCQLQDLERPEVRGRLKLRHQVHVRTGRTRGPGVRRGRLELGA